MGKKISEFTSTEIAITVLLFILGIIPGIIYLIIKTAK